MIPENYLQITEIGTRRSHEISLDDLLAGPVTIGRRPPPEDKPKSHIQIGLDYGQAQRISSYQATITARPRLDLPGGYDFYIQDGAEINGHHKPSANGVWLGGKRLSPEIVFQIRPKSKITVFPKLPNEIYECIIERPFIAEPGDDTAKDLTVQDYESAVEERDLAQQERRLAEAKALHTEKQLEELAKNLVLMQKRFDDEKNSLCQKLDFQSASLKDQSQLVSQINERLKAERELNQQQEADKKRLEKQTKRIRITQGVICLFVLLMAIFAFGADEERISNFLELSIGITGAFGLLMGFAGND